MSVWESQAGFKINDAACIGRDRYAVLSIGDVSWNQNSIQWVQLLMYGLIWQSLNGVGSGRENLAGNGWQS